MKKLVLWIVFATLLFGAGYITGYRAGVLAGPFTLVL